jgi:hypothetical protein
MNVELILRVLLAVVVAGSFGWWVNGVLPAPLSLIASFVGGYLVGTVAFIGYRWV